MDDFSTIPYSVRIVNGVEIGIWVVEGIECTDVNGLWALMRLVNPEVQRTQAQTASSMYTDEMCKVPVSDTSSVMKTLLTLESVLGYLSKYSPRGAHRPLAARRWIISATKEQIDKIVAQFEVVAIDLTEYNRKLAQERRQKQAEEADKLIMQIKGGKLHG